MEMIFNVGIITLASYVLWRVLKGLFGIGECALDIANKARRSKTSSVIPKEVVAVLEELSKLEEITDGLGYDMFDAGPLPNRLDDEDLCEIAKRMARHIGMGDIQFSIEYVACGSGMAGQIRWLDGDIMRPTIFIDYNFARDPCAVIKILAHELAHEYRHLHQAIVKLEDYIEEQMTDVTSVYLGFGKYILNGAAVVDGDVMMTWTTTTTGYISPVCFAYVYELVCVLRNISEAELLNGLNLMARNDLRYSRWTDGFVMPPRHFDKTALVSKIDSIKKIIKEIDLTGLVSDLPTDELARLLDEIGLKQNDKPENVNRLQYVVWNARLSAMERDLMAVLRDLNKKCRDEDRKNGCELSD